MGNANRVEEALPMVDDLERSATEPPLQLRQHFENGIVLLQL
jgi:hypothetical protein